MWGGSGPPWDNDLVGDLVGDRQKPGTQLFGQAETRTQPKYMVDSCNFTENLSEQVSNFM
jgi:hypothetical protein